jgi:carbamoyltransferase
VAHASSATFASGFDPCSVLVLDGRGEVASHLAGRFAGGELDVLATQRLPHSLGLLYEELTAHLGFRRSSDEYKVMAMASYAAPAFLEEFRSLVRADGAGGFTVDPVDLARYAPALGKGEDWTRAHAELAATVQHRLEEVLLDLCAWLHERTGDRDLVMAGGVALNCVANSRIWRESPFERVWVQPASGDSGTALGAALQVAHELGDPVRPMGTAALGRGWDDAALAAQLETADVAFEEPGDVADAVAEALADNQVVAWFQGRAEFGPRALGHRSLLADPRRHANLEKLNDIKGREQFRPVAPMVLAERAAEIFEGGPIPSPFMLFTHAVKDGWAERIPAVVHVDGTARIQTVDREQEPLMARCLERFEARTGVPVVVNTSLNTAGRPMVDDPRDALECFGSSPVDVLAIGPYVVRRAGVARGSGRMERAAA